MGDVMAFLTFRDRDGKEWEATAQISRLWEKGAADSLLSKQLVQEDEMELVEVKVITK